MSSIVDRFPDGSPEQRLAKDIEDAAARIFEQRGGPTYPPPRLLRQEDLDAVGPQYVITFSNIGLCDLCERWFPLPQYLTGEESCPKPGCEGAIIVLERMREYTKADREAMAKEEDEALLFGDADLLAKNMGLTRMAGETNEQLRRRAMEVLWKDVPGGTKRAMGEYLGPR